MIYILPPDTAWSQRRFEILLIFFHVLDFRFDYENEEEDEDEDG
jgi:hypothetical protein